MADGNERDKTEIKPNEFGKVSDIVRPGQAIESSRKLDISLTKSIEDTKRSSLADVAARMRVKKAKHDMIASDWGRRLDRMDAVEPALIEAGESVLSEREADMKEMERNIKVLGNLPFEVSPQRSNGSGSGTDNEDKGEKNEPTDS